MEYVYRSTACNAFCTSLAPSGAPCSSSHAPQRAARAWQPLSAPPPAAPHHAAACPDTAGTPVCPGGTARVLGRWRRRAPGRWQPGWGAIQRRQRWRQQRSPMRGRQPRGLGWRRQKGRLRPGWRAHGQRLLQRCGGPPAAGCCAKRGLGRWRRKGSQVVGSTVLVVVWLQQQREAGPGGGHLHARKRPRCIRGEVKRVSTRASPARKLRSVVNSVRTHELCCQNPAGLWAAGHWLYRQHDSMAPPCVHPPHLRSSRSHARSALSSWAPTV